MIKVLSNDLFSPILLDRNKRGNRCTLGEKTSFEDTLLIFPLYKFFEDAFLLLPLYSLIVSSSFYLFIIGLGIDVFGKNNVRKNSLEIKVQENTNRKKDPSTGADVDGGIRADNLGIETNVDTKADDPDTAANNSGTAADNPDTTADNPVIAADNPSITADNPSTAIDNPGIAVDNLGITIDNSGIAANNPSIETDTDVGANNPSITASNKARAVSLFTLRHAFFLLVSSSKSVTAFLPSSSPSSSLTTLQSKPILLYLVILVKQRAPSS